VTTTEPRDVPPAALSAALDAWQAACMANATNEDAMRHTLAAAFRAVREPQPRRTLSETVDLLRDRLAEQREAERGEQRPGAVTDLDRDYERIYAEEGARLAATELIAGALAQTGLTTRYLAHALDVPHRRVIRWMRGRPLTVVDLAAALEALGFELALVRHPKLPPDDPHPF